jgi:glutamate-1-semialdehyde 2,1-aminomutase
VTPFIGVDRARSFDDVKRADLERFGRLHAAWLDAGILWQPSQFETAFLSTTHTDEDVDRTVESFARALSTVAV